MLTILDIKFWAVSSGVCPFLCVQQVKVIGHGKDVVQPSDGRRWPKNTLANLSVRAMS